MISFDITGTGGFSARVELLQQPDAAHNSSALEVRLYIISTRWLGVTYWLQGQAAERAFSSSYDHVYIDKIGEPAAVGEPWSLQVQHGADGTGTVTVSVKLRGYTADGGYGNGWSVEGSRTVALTPIALASTVKVTPGDETTIAINRRNSGYTHLLGYTFGSLSGYITDSGSISQVPVVCKETVIRFPVPEAFYRQLPHEKQGLCRLRCVTLDGDRQVGVAVEEDFTVTVPESYGPAIAPAVEDINPQTLALTGNSRVAVRFMSRLQCTAAVQGQLGAEILECTAQGQPLPAVVEGAERVLFQAVDSRGYCTQCTVTPKTVPYVLLTANGTCRRVDPTSGTVELTVRGSCYGGSFGTVDNSLQLTATAGGSTYAVTPTVRGDSYEATLRLEGLGYEQSHTIAVTVRDALMTVTLDLLLSRGVPVFDWGKRDFAFHVPITAPSVNGIRNPALKAWPVGAVLLMPADPKDFIGGKWEHFTIPGINLDAWRRLQGADTLGTAVLGQLVLGTEE